MYSLMIVEDEEILREGLQVTIDWESYGFTLIGTAENGIKALELGRKLRPNVILTDIRMPLMDGMELLQKVKEQSSQTQVVLLSAFEEFRYARTGIEYGAFAYILKDSLHEEIAKCFPKLRDHLDTLLQENVFTLRSYLQFSDSSASWLRKCSIFCCAVFWNPDGGELPVPIQWSPQNATLFLKGQYKIFIFGERNADDLNNILRRSFSSFYAEKDERWVLGVGCPKTGRANIAQSYFEAMKAVDFGRLSQTKKIVYNYAAICPDDFVHKSDPGDDSRIETSVMLCKKAALIKYINNSMLDGMKRSDLLISDIQMICHRLFDAFYDHLKMLGASTESVMNRIDDLYSIDSFIDCNNWIVEEISSLCDMLIQQRKTAGRYRIRQVVELLDKRFTEDLKLEDLAHYCYVSVSGFTVKFKEITGLTFSEYVKSKRLEHACYLLKNCNLKIYEVAKDCGYDDEKYFCRIFKSNVGISPVTYRQRFSANELMVRTDHEEAKGCGL